MLMVRLPGHVESCSRIPPLLFDPAMYWTSPGAFLTVYTASVGSPCDACSSRRLVICHSSSRYLSSIFQRPPVYAKQGH